MSPRTGNLIADYPAWSVHEPVAQKIHHLDVSLPIFQAGDILGLPYVSERYGILYHWFRFGSVVSFALDSIECPIRAFENALKAGHKTHWLNPEPVVLSNTQAPKESRIAMNFGDQLIFEGRIFELAPDWNQNVKLVERTPE